MTEGPGVGGAVRGAAREVEAEVKRLIGYMNDEVVPEVRRSSSVGLRAAAEQLQKMAEHLDRAGTGRAAGGSGRGSTER